jgi:hypothetical protein
MASRFQQQSLWRKLAYFFLILVLFTATLIIRNQSSYGVEAQARDMGIREQDLGEVDLTDKAVRLILTGSRGFALCGLWYTAQQKQIKHEWNELELLVRSLIKLQPHFVTPWLFQSWNLAYNVSVECDRVRDKYFYIARGIGLLADGERQNRANPDMRLYVGIYTQNKFGISDEQNTLRSLYQMSCIDPIERDPSRFRRLEGTRSVIDWDQFEDFCQRHPFLVRRLHDSLRCKMPDEIVDFLAANQKLPSIYEDASEAQDQGERAAKRKPLAEQFPVLPPRSNFDPSELTYDSPLGDDFDNYHAARAWFSYAQDPIVAELKVPRFMAQIIFEGYPARAQSYVAERLAKEGWFDETGWTIANWFPRDKSQPSGSKKPVALGTQRFWAGDAWEKAFQMYKDHGERHDINRTPEQVKTLSPDDRYKYEGDQTLSNFPHFYTTTRVERLREAVTARRNFFQADTLRRGGNRELALATYERPDAFPQWMKILLKFDDFRNDEDQQEELYIIQRKYLNLVRERRGPIIKSLLTLAPPSGTLWLPAQLSPAMPIPLKGPFDDAKFLSEHAIGQALSRPDLPPDPTRPQGLTFAKSVTPRGVRPAVKPPTYAPTGP